MEQYEIRVNQLKKLKFSLIFKFFIILFLISIFFVFLFILIKHNYISEINILQNSLFFNIGYFAICLFILIIVSSILLFNFDKSFRNFYVECIYLEAKLEEIYLLDHKVINNKEMISFLKKVLIINKFKFISSFSDASSKYSCDINVVKYKKNKHTFYGTLCSVHYDQEKPGFLQFTHNHICALETYDGREIIEYGMPMSSILRNFRVFSTYGKWTNILEKNEYGLRVACLEKYFKSQIDIVFDNENLYIFVPNYKVELSDSLFSHLNNSRFIDKIDSIKRFHTLSFDLIKLFDELFVLPN